MNHMSLWQVSWVVSALHARTHARALRRSSDGAAAPRGAWGWLAGWVGARLRAAAGAGAASRRLRVQARGSGSGLKVHAGHELRECAQVQGLGRAEVRRHGSGGAQVHVR